MFYHNVKNNTSFVKNERNVFSEKNEKTFFEDKCENVLSKHYFYYKKKCFFVLFLT